MSETGMFQQLRATHCEPIGIAEPFAEWQMEEAAPTNSEVRQPHPFSATRASVSLAQGEAHPL